jgi:hypothetical protein
MQSALIFFQVYLKSMHVLFISNEKTKRRQGETRINAKTVIEAETRFAFVETREASRVFAICGIAEGRAASAAIFRDVPGSHRARPQEREREKQYP